MGYDGYMTNDTAPTQAIPFGAIYEFAATARVYRHLHRALGEPSSCEPMGDRFLRDRLVEGAADVKADMLGRVKLTYRQWDAVRSIMSTFDPTEMLGDEWGCVEL